MPIDIEDRKIWGDHPGLRDPASFPARIARGWDVSRSRQRRQRAEGGKGSSRTPEGVLHHGGHVDPPLPNDRSKAQTLGRTASFTVIFAFFFSSTRYASTAFAPFSFRNAARICSLTMASGTFFPSRTIVAECSA